MGNTDRVLADPMLFKVAVDLDEASVNEHAAPRPAERAAARRAG